MTAIEKGSNGQNENGRVASPESVPTHCSKQNLIKCALLTLLGHANKLNGLHDDRVKLGYAIKL